MYMELDVMLRAIILLPAGQTGGVVSVLADAGHTMAGRRSGIKSNGK